MRLPFLDRGGGGDLGAQHQILDLHHAAGSLVRALDDRNRRGAFIRVFQLVAEIFWVAEIDLGANSRRAQLAHDAHVIGHPIAVHHGHHDRPRCRSTAAPFGAQGGKQAINPDGNAGGRHRLAGEALDQIVIAPAARDRAKGPFAALFVKDFKGQFRLEHRPGVVAKAAHDRGIDHDPVRAIALCGQKL
ncbi:hypothetical protein GALL_519640 [mine drainage metagenome]|uniref:Uncharacterized protein n=1 Tax=mine drainage metagenome TaxID=410659 RepID=A0A1J5PF65_9ZZZZ